MKNIPAIFVFIILVLGVGYAVLFGNDKRELVRSPLNTTYTVEGESITLVAGAFEKETAPESATKVQTSVFGEPTVGDIDGDGDLDAVLLLVQNPGGSGTFYYIAGALNTDGNYQGTNAILLGDRIAPQVVEIKGRQIIANYAERKPNEPLTARPSVGQSKYFMVSGGELVESKNADSGLVTLDAGLNEEVGGLGVSIIPLEVLEDSRCPADVVCIWMGQVRLKAMLSSGLGEAEQIFISGQTITTETEEITLSQVIPIPRSSQEIKPDDYRFRFLVSKRTP